MTREEEIEKASNKYIENYLKASNEYPLCDNRKRMSLIQVDLYKMQVAFENGMKKADKTMLDRACEWLGNRHNIEKCLGVLTSRTEDLSKAFRQAMKGGAE